MPSEEALLSDGVGDDPRYERSRDKKARIDEESRWLAFLREDLGVKVIEDCRFLRDRPDHADDEASLASSGLHPEDDAASITSHEFGVQRETSDEEVHSEDEPELIRDEDVFEGKTVLFLHKEKRKKLNQLPVRFVTWLFVVEPALFLVGHRCLWRGLLPLGALALGVCWKSL